MNAQFTETLAFVEDEYPGATPGELLESLAGICSAMHRLPGDGELKQLALAAHVLSRQAVERISVSRSA